MYTVYITPPDMVSSLPGQHFPPIRSAGLQVSKSAGLQFKVSVFHRAIKIKVLKLYIVL